MKKQKINLILIEGIKKVLANILIFAFLFNAFNLSTVLFYLPVAEAAKINEHKSIVSKPISTSNNLVYPNRLKNYIITTFS
jgi:hypothetical protein